MQGLGEILLNPNGLKLTLPNHELFNCRTAQSKMYFIWDGGIRIQIYLVIKEPSQAMKPSLKTSAPQPTWTKPLNITVDATYSIESCQRYPELEHLLDLLSYCIFMKCFEWFQMS